MSTFVTRKDKDMFPDKTKYLIYYGDLLYINCLTTTSCRASEATAKWGFNVIDSTTPGLMGGSITCTCFILVPTFIFVQA